MTRARMIGAGLAGLTLALLAGPPTEASADGTSCPDLDDGSIIVRLGQEVHLTQDSPGLAFRFPAGLYWRAIPAEPSDDPSLPPLGCPGNPIVALSIAFPFTPVTPDEIAAGAPDVQPHRVMISGGDGPARLQRNYLIVLEDYREMMGPAACDVVGGQLEFCRSCPEPNKRPGFCRRSDGTFLRRTEVPAYFKALPGAYGEFDGVPYAGICSGLRGIYPTPTTGRPCEVDYKLLDGLTVAYRFDDADLAEDDFLAFDRLVRSRVLATRAPEYDRVAP